MSSTLILVSIFYVLCLRYGLASSLSLETNLNPNSNPTPTQVLHLLYRWRVWLISLAVLLAIQMILNLPIAGSFISIATLTPNP